MIRLGLHALLLVALLAPAQNAPAVVEFYQTFDSMQDLDTSWTKSSWSGRNRTHSPDNVAIKDGILNLTLKGTLPGTLPVCAEVVSRKRDFFHGTYRASIKMTSKPGAVVGWFTYRGNPLNEVDIEFLTRNPRRAYFTLHHVKTSVDHAERDLDFDPSSAFHEYRFDWYADRVEYYVDNHPMATLSKDVPDQPSALLLNHWSGNIDGWGGAAPTEDVVMEVDWVYHSNDYRAPPRP